MTSDEIIKLIQDNGLTLHGDIEHFAALVRDDYSYKPWVGLTPEDYGSMRPRVPYIVNDFSFADVAAIVEAKLKEKNA